ncbi:uncharacterized protein An11g05200 [Aspergillus niger]|uniref:Contig An11c0210, genomic contig n=2 Tax=Aspergillus niger TaxID=5061 RepID=A2QWH8_ASPNC|nr:uncharacterized protein An11g05200 [Aspergillus niger]CAL00372.1 unnamed protein product [Aspergillus niger]
MVRYPSILLALPIVLKSGMAVIVAPFAVEWKVYSNTWKLPVRDICKLPHGMNRIGPSAAKTIVEGHTNPARADVSNECGIFLFVAGRPPSAGSWHGSGRGECTVCTKSIIGISSRRDAPQCHAEQGTAEPGRSFDRHKRQNLVDLTEEFTDISGYMRIYF